GDVGHCRVGQLAGLGSHRRPRYVDDLRFGQVRRAEYTRGCVAGPDRGPLPVGSRTGVREGGTVRVLAVDPGLTRCGYAVVEGGRGGLTALAYDVVRTAAGDDIGARLAAVADRLEAQIDRLAPDVVAVERVFSQHNVRTVMCTAQASGVAILAAARAGVPVALHTPSEVKAAVTGSGRADKAQVTTMVTKVLRLPAS